MRQSLEENEEATDEEDDKKDPRSKKFKVQRLNVNCLDYMGRSALHLAVDSDSIETVELLLDRVDFDCIEEALLHAISKGATKTVRIIIEHPNYIAGAELARKSRKDPFFRTDEKSQFSPDITPLILAAHYNNHEIIQMFLSRNHTLDRPHPISCQCADCVTKQNYDSLKRSRSRLNAYRALASPAYMALSSPDPIMSTFELRQEMKKLAQVEKEFKVRNAELFLTLCKASVTSQSFDRLHIFGLKSFTSSMIAALRRQFIGQCINLPCTITQNTCLVNSRRKRERAFCKLRSMQFPAPTIETSLISLMSVRWEISNIKIVQSSECQESRLMRWLWTKL